MKKKMDRRQFIKNSSKALATAALLDGPFSLLMDAISQGAISRAYAETTGSSPRKWVDMRTYGAPPRWVYDLILKNGTADDANFVPGTPGGQLANKLVLNGDGRYTSGIYSTIKVGNLGLPHIWGTMVPSVGGTRPMTDLLSNFLILRGINTGNPGHGGSEAGHFRAPGSVKSLPAIAGDSSTAPIAAAFSGNPMYSYYSAVGKSPLLLTGNYFTAIAAPFSSPSSVTNIRQRELLLKTYIDATRTALASRAIRNHPDAQIIKTSIHSAQAMMGQAFSTMATQYVTLQAKYAALISRALATTIVGVNDYPIGAVATAAAPRNLHHQVAGRKVNAADLRTLVDPTRTSADSANPNASSAIPSMANSFAIAELVLLNGFSDSLTLELNSITAILDGTVVSGYVVDEHFTGMLASVYINSLYAVAHASCMLEFIERLKAANIWNETVVAVGSEFNRAPLNNGSGSNHAPNAASIQLYSGCIPGPMVLGHIASDLYPTDYKGTYGAGALVPELGLPTDLGHLTNTVASLLRQPMPVSARQPMVDGSGNTAVATIPTGKIVV